MKKCLSIILSIFLCVCLMPFNAISVAAFVTGDCSWVLEGTHLTIFGEGPMEDYASPGDSYEGGCGPWGDQITSVTIEPGVTTIGANAFFECNQLTSVTIPNTITTIGENAFYKCENLMDVSVPHGISTIKSGAFNNCSKLSSINLPDSITYIGESAFANTAFYNNEDNWVDNVLYIKNHLIRAKNTLSGAYAISEGTVTIAGGAFSICSKLVSVTIPYGVITIGEEAFYACDSLVSLSISNSVVTIGDRAFMRCDELLLVDVPDSVETVGIDTFAYCSALSSVRFGKGLMSIGLGAFDFCNALVSFEVSEANPYYAALDGTLFNKNKTVLLKYPGGRLGGYTIPAGVTEIGEGAFFYHQWITSVIISGNVNVIRKSSFAHCDVLASVTIGDSVTTIGEDAFAGCKKMTSLTLGKQVSEIGCRAFYWCTKLTEVIIPDGVQTIGVGAFARCSKLAAINLPDSIISVGAEIVDDTAYYEDAANWENGILYIGRHLIRADWDLSGVYAIKEGTLVVADAAFMDCSEVNAIYVPASVITIGESAFTGCESLVSIDVDDDNVNYSSGAGVLFNKDKTILIQCGGGKEGEFAVPDSVSSIQDNAFKYCRKLTSVVIPNGVMTIGEYAFYSCSGLTSVVIPNRLTHIANDTFGACSSLKTVVIPDSVVTIGNHAFSWCADLTSIEMGCNVKEIGVGAFYGTVDLDAVYYNGTEEDRDKINGVDNLLHAQWYYVACDHTYNNIYDPDCNECGFIRDVPDVICGDTDYDGNINNQDLARLQQYLNEWDVTIDKKAADTNGDGQINNKDLGLLQQYLNEWDVVLK